MRPYMVNSASEQNRIKVNQ